ncbi:BTAD domain-containing putative transcriptional regulator [Lentzea sp. NPDC004782]|uniref:AfsR/SARP family transcriptional regulator n=1 Tax=Lentzea sp. NPDC004782 TaxID=3154458 RepID=UPI0033A42E60
MIAEYRVLGPLEVLADGVPVPVPAGRGRVLLATLLLRANELVTVDELIDRVWDGEPPAPDRAHKTLQMTVSRLRQALGDANCVQTSSRGYSALVRPDQLDLSRFRALASQGEHRAALELWRGPVLANVASESLHRDDVPRLVEEQVVALERRIDQDLARDTDVLVPELRALVRRYPLRETFSAQLMLALHRSNQQAEALAVYQEVRDRLVDELGVDPGPRLREAHEQVLSGEVPSASVPRQLPAGVPHFVGREEELARLTRMLATRPGEPVLISAINGIGGVGKTAFALEWAHQVADRFPDGQLYVNLRGFDTRAEPLDPLTAARDFLLALGVPAKDVPASEDALLAAYRSALAERRVLLLLDNARDVAQVRPLLPGGAANLVLVTSRNRLSGLVARKGAQPVALDVMDEPAAVGLLTDRIGAARVAAEPDAVLRLVKRCAGLPLALGIVAARAAFGDSLTSLADELEQERLDALDLDDASGVRAVFSWSLRAVGEAAAGVFVLLGLHPGPDFSVEAAASLAGVSRVQARRMLTELANGSLVMAQGTRFILHDLVRDYVAERAAELPPDQRADALHRMFDHYLHTSLEANQRTELTVSWTPLAPPSPAVVLAAIPDWQAADEWFRVEWRVLLRVLTEMVAAGADDLVWRLGYTLHLPLLRPRRLVEVEAAELLALAAAQRRDDVFGQARLHRSLGGVYIAKTDYLQAEHHLRSALRCEEVRGNNNGRVDVSRGLAFVFEMQERLPDALEALQRVHPIAVGGLVSEYQRALFLGALGRVHHLLGDSARGLELCLESDALYAELDDRVGTVAVTTVYETLGDIYLTMGSHGEAAVQYQRAVSMLRAIHSVADLADALAGLAKAHIAAGDRGAARTALAEAVQIYEELGSAGTGEARELLASLD